MQADNTIFGVDQESVTAVLNRGRNGDDAAFKRWIDLVYKDLRRLAAYRMATSFDQPLRSLTESPTAIAHEAIVKLLAQREPWENREHFFAVATRLIGYIVSDYKDRRSAAKRGGGNRGGGGDGFIASLPDDDDAGKAFEALEALKALHQEYPRAAEVVSLHVFAKNSLVKVAEMIAVSVPTVERDWKFSKAWLKNHLKPAGGVGNDS
jgi:RNA polymerase sigma factor (TIGR02999 family)